MKTSRNKANSINKKKAKPSMAVLILVVFFALSMGYRANQDDAVTNTSLLPDEAIYAVRGPHPVGIRDLVIEGVNLEGWKKRTLASA